MSGPMPAAPGGAGGPPQSSKVPFRVVFVSSEDPGFPGSMLESTSPHTKGWQSARFCEFPQQIIVQFNDETEVKQIQILSHQSKIANKIEIAVGSTPPGVEPHYSQARFTRLGYLSLDSNQRSNYKARELKSVYVTAVGRFIKFSIRKCHLNTENLFNQVGIVALNVMGKITKQAPWDDLSVGMEMDSTTLGQIQQLSAAKAKAIEVEDYDEAKRLKQAIDGLTKLGGQIAELEKRKKIAVSQEDFDTAKRIKMEIDHLRNSVLAAGGNAAVQAMGGAASQAPAVRMIQRHAEPAPDQYQDRNGFGMAMGRADDVSDPHADMFGMQPAAAAVQTGPPSRAMSSRHSRQPSDHDHDRSSHGSEQGFGTDTSPNQRAGGRGLSRSPEAQVQQSPVPFDERPLPNKGGGPGPAMTQERNVAPNGRKIRVNASLERALPGASNASHHAVFSGMADPESVDQPFGSKAAAAAEGPDMGGEPEELGAAHMKDAELLLPVLGDFYTRCIFSVQSALRDNAVAHLELELRTGEFDMDKRTLFEAVNRVLRLGIRDKVPRVFLSSCALLDTVLPHFSPHLKADLARPGQAGLVQHLPVLTAKLADNNARVRAVADQLLTRMAMNAYLGVSVVGDVLLKVSGKTDKPVLHKTRAQLIARLIRQFGVTEAQDAASKGPALSLAPVMDIMAPALVHRDEGVRNMAMNVVAELYLLVGEKALVPYMKKQRQGIRDALKKTFEVADAQPAEERDQMYAVQEVPLPRRTKEEDMKMQQDRKQAASAANQSQLQPHNLSVSRGSTSHSHMSHKPLQHGGVTMAGEFSPSHPHTPSAHGMDDEDDGFCQFCGREDPELTEEKLDLHYWQECPMLTSCKLCEQVIEIPTLNEHLLTECELGADFKQCPRCKEPIRPEVYQEHVKSATCLGALPHEQANRCPLCHQNIEPGLQGWKQHLLVDLCPENSRTQGQASV